MKVLGLLLAALLVLTACGSDDTTSSSDSSGNASSSGGTSSDQGAEQPALDFYQCLRDQGLDVADPDFDGGGGAQVSGPGGGLDMDDPATADAVDICREEMGDSGGQVTFGDGQMGDNVASSEALIAYVDCIREHGFDMPDPSADGRLSFPGDVDPQSSEFQAAAQDCGHHLDGAGVLIGDGNR